MAIVGLLLAAGFSRRLGAANKLTQPLADGRAIGLAAARHLLAAIFCAIAVIRPDDYELAAPFAAAVNYCNDIALTVTGFVIALVDMPFISASRYARAVHQLEQRAS